MASTLPPVKGAAFYFEIGLVDQGDTDVFQTSPTLANGDVLVIKDGMIDGNIDTLPTAITGALMVLGCTLSATEMTADRVTVIFHDVAGDEWQDAVVTIYTGAQTLDTMDTNIDDIETDTGTTLDDLVDDLETRLTATRAGYLDNLANVTSGSVTVISPVNAEGTLLTLVRGDDYDADDGTELDFASTSYPVLTGATITFTVERGGIQVLTCAGSVVSATEARVELTAAQTALFPVGTRSCQYDVQASLVTSGHIVTLARGDITVLEDYS